MASSFYTEMGIALSGESWGIGDFRLFESTHPDVILYMPNRSFLSVNSDNRKYQVALNIFRRWDQGVDLIKRGSLSFTTILTLIPQYEFLLLEAMKQEWEKEILNSGYVKAQNLTFLPLPTRNIQVQIILDPSLGKVTIPQVGDTSVVAAGETTFFLLELTEKGAKNWTENIESRTKPAGDLIFTYEYPQLLPQVQAKIQVNGKSIFAYLSSVLFLRGDGYYYGSREKVEIAWKQLIQDQLIEIKLPDPLPPELTEMQQNMIKTFAEQIRYYLFDQLFVFIAESDVESSEEDDLGVVIYKLKWREQTDVVELSFELTASGGWTWLKGSMSTNFTTLFQELDSSYVNAVYLEQSFPVSITVQGEPLLNTLVLSWSTDEGKLPEVLVFNTEGGKQEYTLTSQNPENVTIHYQAKAGFQLTKWPVIELEEAKTVAEGGNKILLQPGHWIRHLMINLVIQEGDQAKLPAELQAGDYLVVNVLYEGFHLPTKIKESARISPVAPMRFTYLQDPKGRASQLYLSGIGVLGGQMIRISQQRINPDEENVFILVSNDGVQIVSQESIISENNALARRLLDGQSRLGINQLS